MSFLLRMGEYMLWADEKIWDIVKTLTDEEYSRTFNDNSGSIRDRYLHMVHGHSRWYFRWIDNEPAEEHLERLTRPALFSYLSSINTKIINLVQENSLDALQISLPSGNLLFRLEEMIFNIINHATYHRGQIITLLRMLGKDVVVTDYFPYLLSRIKE